MSECDVDCILEALWHEPRNAFNDWIAMPTSPTDRAPPPAHEIPRHPPVPRVSWAYFLDIDGTLAEFADVPAQARIAPAVRDVVDGLFRATGGAVALVSGRSLADVDRLYPGCAIPVADQHGMEWRDASGAGDASAMDPRELDEARKTLAWMLTLHPGLLLEDKGLSLALHFRQHPALAGVARSIMESVRGDLGPRFAVQAGNHVIELKSASVNKDQVIRRFMRSEPFIGRTPVFAGDDVTDEYGFVAVNVMEGVSIKIGPGDSIARWCLPDVDHLVGWLKSAV